MPVIQYGSVASATNATPRAKKRPFMAHACRKGPAAAAAGRAASEGRDEIRKLGQERLAEIVDEADDDTADKGAEQTAGAAENDHDQRERQHVLIKPGIDRKDRPANDAGESCKTRAEREDDGEQLRHADANDARHVRIVHAGADHGAEPGAFKKKPKADGNDHGDHDDRQPIVRENQYAQTREAGEFRRRGDRKRVAAPYDQAEIRGHEGQAERHQHLCQLVARQTPQQQAFGQCAEQQRQ